MSTATAVKSFREAASGLRRPFTPEAVKFKVQATWPKGNEPTGGLVVAYIDARLVVERLNLLLPDRWSDHYEPAPWLGKNFLLCHLTVDGLTRSDVGEGQGKGLMSDALKRAAVKFGVGVSLYAIPKMTIDLNSGHAKRRQTREGITLEMTPAGENRVKGIYRMWLDAHGSQAFGEPLDHGDVENAQGDPEDETVPDNGPELVTPEDVETLKGAASGMTAAQIKEAMVSCGITPGEPFNGGSLALVPKAKVGLLAEALRLAPRTRGEK